MCATIALTENFLLTDLALKRVSETERESCEYVRVCKCGCAQSIPNKRARVAAIQLEAGELFYYNFFLLFATLVKTDLNKVWMRERECARMYARMCVRVCW